MKQFRNSLAVALVFVFMTLVAALAQTDPEELLESGVYMEEVEGKLEGAIEIFEQLFASHLSQTCLLPASKPLLALQYFAEQTDSSPHLHG